MIGIRPIQVKLRIYKGNEEACERRCRLKEIENKSVTAVRPNECRQATATAQAKYNIVNSQ